MPDTQTRLAHEGARRQALARVASMLSCLCLGHFGLCAAPGVTQEATGGGTLPEFTLGAREIRLDGKVQSIDVPHASVVLLVDGFTLPTGKAQTLATPKPKTIRVPASCSLHVRGSKQTVVLKGLMAADALIVVGDDTGTGQDLTAREAAVWNQTKDGKYDLRDKVSTVDSPAPAPAFAASSPTSTAQATTTVSPANPVAGDIDITDDALTNSSFSDGEDSPAEWKLDDQARGKVTLSRDVTTFKSAPAALRLDSTSTEGGRVSQNIVAIPPGTFTLHGYCKTDGKARIVGILLAGNFEGAQWHQLGWRPFPIQAAEDWEAFSYTYQAPPRTTSLLLSFEVHGQGKAWLDDLRVTQALADVPLEYQDIVPNGDFSEGTTKPSGWTLEDAGVGARLARDTEVFKGGPASLRVDSGDDSKKFSVVAKFAAKPANEFIVTGYVKSAGQWPSLRAGIQVLGTGGNQIDYIDLDLGAHTTWRRFARTVVLPPGAREVLFRLEGKGRGQVWLDEVKVRKSNSTAIALKR